MRIIRTLAIALLITACAIAQNEFEAASIRPAAPTEERVDIGMHIDGSLVRFNYLSMLACMRIAYEMKPYQFVGPEWIVTDHFNIAAKIPAGASEDQVRVMKSSLDVQATGSAAGVFADPGSGAYFTFADNHLIGHKLPMWRVADVLSNFMDKPVIDITGLSSSTNYDLSLAITADDYRTMMIRGAVKSGIDLPPEAAGLRLEGRKAPQDVIVIDHADKTATEN